MGRAAAAAAPTDPKQIMEARRAAYREEQGLPDVKWSCFAEQRKHEDFAAVGPQRGNRACSMVLTGRHTGQVRAKTSRPASEERQARPEGDGLCATHSEGPR